MDPTMGYNFIWNSISHDYMTAAYSPSFSQGRITPHDIEVLMQSVRQVQHYNFEEYDPCVAPLFIPGINLLAIIFCCLPCQLHCRAVERNRIRQAEMTQVLKTLEETHFKDKDVTLKVSPKGGVLQIMFNWKWNQYGLNPGAAPSTGVNAGQSNGAFAGGAFPTGAYPASSPFGAMAQPAKPPTFS